MQILHSAKKDDDSEDEHDETLPRIGVRVRRGPDWKWDNQDSHGVGTISGHSTTCESQLTLI